MMGLTQIVNLNRIWGGFRETPVVPTREPGVYVIVIRLNGTRYYQGKSGPVVSDYKYANRWGWDEKQEAIDEAERLKQYFGPNSIIYVWDGAPR